MPIKSARQLLGDLSCMAVSSWWALVCICLLYDGRQQYLSSIRVNGDFETRAENGILGV